MLIRPRNACSRIITWKFLSATCKARPTRWNIGQPILYFTFIKSGVVDWWQSNDCRFDQHADTTQYDQQNFMDINSFVISQDTSKNYNQIKGRKMIADFRAGKLIKVFVNGNGESIYFAIDEKTNKLPAWTTLRVVTSPSSSRKEKWTVSASSNSLTEIHSSPRAEEKTRACRISNGADERPLKKTWLRKSQTSRAAKPTPEEYYSREKVPQKRALDNFIAVMS